MKRRFFILMAALMTSLILTIPASAAEYGVIYTEAESLYSAELEVLGQDHLPWFTETYGIDLRVDVLTSLVDFNSVEEVAPVIYDTYEYGYGEGRNGVTLTLLVHEDEDGVALDEWYVYAAGDSDELTTNGPWNVYPNLNEIMTEENWSGDAEQDTKALEAAVVGMRDGLAEFVLAGGVADTIWSPVPQNTVPQQGQTQAPSAQAPAATQLSNVTDMAGLLTDGQRQELEQQARSISEQYGVGVYLVTVDDYRDYTNGNIYDAADCFHQGGEEQSLLLLLSMNDRSYVILAYGDYAQYAFNDAGLNALEDYFLDDFGSDDWYTGFVDYISWSADYLENAEAGEPYSDWNVPMSASERSAAIMIRVATIFLVPLVIAGVYILILSARMKSVATAVEASAYISGDLNLSRNVDLYTHTTTTRERIEKESSSGRSSGGGAGRSGNF